MLAEEEAADFVQNLRAICPLGSPFVCPFQAFSVGLKESWFTQAVLNSPTVLPRKAGYLGVRRHGEKRRSAQKHRAPFRETLFHAFQLISFYKSGKSIHSFVLFGLKVRFSLTCFIFSGSCGLGFTWRFCCVEKPVGCNQNSTRCETGVARKGSTDAVIQTCLACTVCAWYIL